MDEPVSDDDQLKHLAARLQCFTSAELRAVARITQSTEEQWRKRHLGPPYAMVGNVVLYPVEGVYRWLRERVRQASTTLPKSAL